MAYRRANRAAYAKIMEQKNASHKVMYSAEGKGAVLAGLAYLHRESVLTKCSKCARTPWISKIGNIIDGSIFMVEGNRMLAESVHKGLGMKALEAIRAMSTPFCKRCLIQGKVAATVIAEDSEESESDDEPEEM